MRINPVDSTVNEAKRVKLKKVPSANPVHLLLKHNINDSPMSQKEASADVVGNYRRNEEVEEQEVGMKNQNIEEVKQSET